MTYLVLVSHGDFARGLKNSLGMFASEEIEKVRVFGLQPGESTDNFGKRFLCEVEKLPQETRLIVLADIVGGSPLATICKVLDKQKMLENSLMDLTVPVSSTFSGNAFSKPVTTGDPAAHYYKLTGKWMPTITTGHSSATEAAQSPQIVRQKRKAYLPVQIEDENSTSTKLFMSPIVSEEELATTTFTEKAHLSRENLTENFETTIEYETSQLQPEKMYYVGMYTVDAEGNQSETKIQAIDFKGIIELTTVPTAFVGNTLTINELVQTKREDGYFYMKIENLPENDSLTITNTSSYSWELSGQLANIVEQLESWGQEVSLCFFEKNTQTLLFQLTKDEQLILKQEVEGKDVTKSLNDYDLYFRFKADPLKVVPGRYSGNVRWRLSEVKP